MRLVWFFLVLLMLMVTAMAVGGSRILFVTLYGSRSHVKAFMPAIKALTARGHNITYLTLYEPEHASDNSQITVLPLEKVKNYVAATRPNFFETMDVSYLTMFRWLSNLQSGVCSAMINDPSFDAVIADNRTGYDAVVIDPSFAECALSLVWLLGSPPLIYYCTTTLYSWTAMKHDIPSPFAYVPLYLSPYTDQMSFSERYVNTFASLGFIAFLDHHLVPLAENIIRKRYPDMPPLLPMMSNASFLLANSHSPSVDLSRPLAPFMAEVGGTNCRPPRPLSKEIEAFVAGAGDHGFIYFSIGSYITASDMHPKKIRAFLNAFGKLKQRVIWKFDMDLMDVPSNVMLIRWAPQQDLLGHPKVKLFITQGGQLSVHEAVYHGVPMLGLPIFGEHFSTFSNYKRKGMAEFLEYSRLTEDAIYGSVMKMLGDAKYKRNALLYSQLFRDRPMPAIDEIVYWIEYVIRHNGGHHLRFNTEHLNFFQYFLLDGIALMLIISVLFLYVFVKGMKILFFILGVVKSAIKEGGKKTTKTIRYKKLK